MKNLFSKHQSTFFVLNLLVILIIIFLPYYLFNGKLFINGDDSRLYYSFPFHWIRNLSFFSWYHFSSRGISGPTQYTLPFLSIVGLVSQLLQSKVITSYLFFSLPLIFGFVFMQKLLKLLYRTNDYKFEFTIGAIFYVFSPILSVNELSIFLYSVWLIGITPLFVYLLIKYINTGSKSLLILSLLTLLFFAFVFASIPWFLGFILCAVMPLPLFLKLFYKKNIIFKRSMVFIISLIISQTFWVLPYALNFLLPGRGAISNIILSKSVSNTFDPTVSATATGNILYPILNLFHRQIMFDFNWQAKSVFQNFYDKIMYLNLLYPIVGLIGIFSIHRKMRNENFSYLYILFSFVASLFFFTVNIDILKNIFQLFGIIPGFVMFRNFYDKFAFSFIFFYSLFFAISLTIVNNRFKRIRKYINFAVIIVIFINLIPIRQIINKPLWTTKDAYTIISIPSEYTKFILKTRNVIDNSSNILSLPYNIAGYSFIKDTNTNNVYAGTSPVILFTGVNDFSGDLSFAGTDSATFKEALLSKNYSQIQNIMHKYAINYIFVTNNIPQEVKSSYLFEPKILAAQDETFIASISVKLLLSSTKGNYQLYTVKDMTPLISGKDVTFQKLSPVKFRVTIKNLKGNEVLTYRDTYNGDWELFPEAVNNIKNCTVVATYTDYATSECARGNSFTFAELQYLFAKSIPDAYHKPLNDFGNTWAISEAYIKKNFSTNTYTLNKDGSMNITFTLYFVPQTYFYIGTLISVLTFAGLGVYVLYDYRKKKKK